MKKKLAIITHEYYPVLSGGTIFAEKLAIEFAQLGYEVEILTPKIGDSYPRIESQEHFKVRRFYTGRQSAASSSLLEHLLMLVLGLPQMLWYIWRQKFALLFNIFVVPAGLIGLIIAKILRIPTFAFVDAADTPGIESQMQHIMKLLTVLFRLVTNNSDGVIVCGGLEDVALPMVTNRFKTAIPNGTSIPSRQVEVCSHGDTVRFLSIGRMVLRKGFGDIIKALQLVKMVRNDFHLDIIGYGANEDEVRALLRQYNLEENITMHGRVEYDRLADFYLASDVYIFYGGREGSSLAMIEGLSWGMPIVASDDPGNRTYVEPGKNGYLVPWQNPEKLSRAIITLLENKATLPQMGKSSREIAELYTWGHIAQRYHTFFEQVRNQQ